MYKHILKQYENEKQNIDKWFLLLCIDKETICKTEDIIECVYHIGKAHMIAMILEKDFGEKTKEDRVCMTKIKDYLENLVCWKGTSLRSNIRN